MYIYKYIKRRVFETWLRGYALVIFLLLAASITNIYNIQMHIYIHTKGVYIPRATAHYSLFKSSSALEYFFLSFLLFISFFRFLFLIHFVIYRENTTTITTTVWCMESRFLWLTVAFVPSRLRSTECALVAVYTRLDTFVVGCPAKNIPLELDLQFLVSFSLTFIFYF